ncbi:MAG: sigma 54-dependent Fis family transcriptional regulator [Sandaracinaceae bacterium]|nr:sigma 54-dependent Fis family transcriptional regulator [Sandaracinaceae bacterium]
MSTVATIHSDALGPRSADGLQLVVFEGPDRGRAVRLDAPRTVGTDTACDLVLTDDRVSRRHVRVGPGADGGISVEDLESKNGTQLEGSRVERAHVGVGATLKVGRTFLRVAPLSQPLVVTPTQERRFGEMVAESLTMREVFAVLALAARTDVHVLLEGETGVGKELAARGVHLASPRREGPFVTVDCSALPPSLIESALFGHVRGAFTGAAAARDGAFVRASGGTLFLDELDSAPPDTQTRLLRAIERRRVQPVGGDDEREVDIRLIAASRRDLSALVASGELRADLFYRLSVMRIRIPPLRERREDVAPTAREILIRQGMADPGPIAGPNLDRLFAHDWPGNARELRNVLERARVLSPEATSFGELGVSLAPIHEPGGLRVRGDLPFHDAKREVLDAFERAYVEDLIARHEGNLTAAARAAGLDRKSLRRLAQKHGLSAPRSEGPAR